MSAFIVDDNHINVIVSYFVDYRQQYQLWYELGGKYNYMSKENAEEVADCLHAQNVRSVNDRYSETNDTFYTFDYIEQAKQAYSIGEIAGALSCLEYQSCESDDYYTTDAYKLICSMRKHLLSKIADREDTHTWEITEVKNKSARVS